MRRLISSVLLILFLAISCSHTPFPKEGMGIGKTMFYEYTIDEVKEATLEVLQEQEWKVTTIDDEKNQIFAKKEKGIPGLKSKIELSLRQEGDGTWLEIERYVPPKLTPGAAFTSRFSINDLFYDISVELEKNY